MDEISPPPEAVLLETLRKAARPKLSVRAAADAAGMHESRWRQIAKGYQQASQTVRIAVRAPADTLARMAAVVGATTDQLKDVGRSDAADELRAAALPAPTAHVSAAFSSTGSFSVDAVDLTSLPADALLGEISRRLRLASGRPTVDESEISPPINPAWVDDTAVEPPAVRDDENPEQTGKFSSG